MAKKKLKKLIRFRVMAPGADPLSTDFATRLTFRLTLDRYNFFPIRDIILNFCVVIHSHPSHIFHATDTRLINYRIITACTINKSSSLSY